MYKTKQERKIEKINGQMDSCALLTGLINSTREWINCLLELIRKWKVIDDVIVSMDTETTRKTIQSQRNVKVILTTIKEIRMEWISFKKMLFSRLQLNICRWNLKKIVN